MEEKINEIKNEFKLKLTKINLNYDNIFLPLTEKILNIIGKNPIKWPSLECEGNIDVFYETIYHFYITNLNNEIILKIPNRILLNLMGYRKIIYFINLIVRTYEEVIKFKTQTKTLINEIYGTSRPENINVLFDLINLDEIPKNELSAISFFKYFIGFEFNKENIGLTLNELKEKLGNDGHVFVNIVYNMKFIENNLYVYHNVKERIGLKFLTKDIVKQFKPIEKVENNNPNKLILKSEIKDKNYIVLQYNNNCFTLYNETLNKHQLERFINGALPLKLNSSDLLKYTTNIYYNELSNLIDVSDKLEKVKLIDYGILFNSIISPIYEYMKNDFKYSVFVDEILKNVTEKKLVNSSEIKLFTFYIKNYVFEEFNIDDFNGFMRAYFP